MPHKKLQKETWRDNAGIMASEARLNTRTDTGDEAPEATSSLLHWDFHLDPLVRPGARFQLL